MYRRIFPPINSANSRVAIDEEFQDDELTEIWQDFFYQHILVQREICETVFTL